MLTRIARRLGLARSDSNGHNHTPHADTPDEFVAWTRMGLPGMLEPGNLAAFEHAVVNLPSAAPVVEIGTFNGLSTMLLGYYLHKHGRPNDLFTCDRWKFEGEEKDLAPGGAANWRELMRGSYLRYAEYYHQKAGQVLPHTIEKFSDEFFEAWRWGERERDVFGRDVALGGPVSFVYIDGNHTYDFARRDFEHADEFLVPGGFILFDDSKDGTVFEGVARVVGEVEATGRYELESKAPNYFFRKR